MNDHHQTRLANYLSRMLVSSHLSHGQKTRTLLSMKYWLVNRDPYNGLLFFNKMISLIKFASSLDINREWFQFHHLPLLKMNIRTIYLKTSTKLSPMSSKKTTAPNPRLFGHDFRPHVTLVTLHPKSTQILLSLQRFFQWLRDIRIPGT